MTADDRSSEELLREIADGDLSSVGGLSPSRMRGKRGGLIEPESRQLVEVAALAAVDAPMEAWRAHLGARGTLIDLDKITGALIAVAPIIGGPKVVAAASNIVDLAGFPDELDEEPI